VRSNLRGTFHPLHNIDDLYQMNFLDNFHIPIKIVVLSLAMTIQLPGFEVIV
jgi:hypothetical protein